MRLLPIYQHKGKKKKGLGSERKGIKTAAPLRGFELPTFGYGFFFFLFPFFLGGGGEGKRGFLFLLAPALQVIVTFLLMLHTCVRPFSSTNSLGSDNCRGRDFVCIT